MNRGITVLIILITTTFLSGCSLVGTMEKTGCRLLPDGNTKDHCWQDAAVRLSMPSVCYFIKGHKFGIVDNSPPMTKCFLRIAEKERDPFICSKIVEGHPNGYTQSDCYMATALAAKNTAYCDFITRNESRGFGIQITSVEECYRQVGNRPRYCEGDPNPATCLSSTAITMLDVTICEDAGDTKTQQLCLMNAIEGIQQSMIAGKTGEWNAQQCRGFNDPNLKYTCSLFAAAAGQTNACDNILETQYHELCTLLIGYSQGLPSEYKEEVKQKAVDECNTFTIEPFKAACLISFGHEIELTASNIGDDATRDAMNKDAVEFYIKGCDMLGTQDMPPEAGFICIMLPSGIMQSPYCTAYDDERTRDLCHELDAMQTGDCSKIKDAEIKGDCKEGALAYYKAMQKKCGKLSGEPYKECQETFKAGFFMQGLGVRMPETLKKFMDGK